MDNVTKPKKRTSFFSLFLIILLLCSVAGYIVYTIRGIELNYEQANAASDKAAFSGSVALIEIPHTNKKLNIPSWNLFSQSGSWLYVSSVAPLAPSFVPSNLITTKVPHGDVDMPMQIQSTIEMPLEKLFTAAKENGHPLMLSSAYRSINDQQTLYDKFVEAKGAEQAKLYVALPGSSEHHTGLSVDISDVSPKCERNSDLCSISFATSTWLSKNAATYGFIQRYPEGKKSVTGIAFEPWHYRYVGIPMAKAVTDSELAFDEIIQQIAPGYVTEKQSE